MVAIAIHCLYGLGPSSLCSVQQSYEAHVLALVLSVYGYAIFVSTWSLRPLGEMIPSVHLDVFGIMVLEISSLVVSTS